MAKFCQIIAVFLAGLMGGASLAADSLPATVIFEKRILPILKSPKPSSCVECHLAGVDLKDYLRPTAKETYAALLAGGMVDVDRPENSKILRFIARTPDKPNLITEKMRAEELSAVKEWLLAAVADPKLRDARTNDVAQPSLPAEVVRHARQDRVLASFLDNVWSEVGRCAACHSPDQNQKQVKEHGAQVSWITLRDPRGTLDHLLEAGIIDLDAPEKSLLLLKPTLQVKHGGGQKMVIGDRTYKQFLAFAADYSATVKGKYTLAKQLPPRGKEVSQATQIWLKLTDVPAKYDKQLLQVDLHRATENGWAELRAATSDRAVFGGGKLWQHSLSLTAERDSAEAKDVANQRLPPGKYLLKVYVDEQGKLAANPTTAVLGREELVAEIEVESRWPAGYGQMTVVKIPAGK